MTISEFRILMTNSYMTTNYPSAYMNLLPYFWSGQPVVDWQRIAIEQGYITHDDFQWILDELMSISLIDQTGYDYLIAFQPAIGAPQQEPLGTNVQ